MSERYLRRRNIPANRRSTSTTRDLRPSPSPSRPKTRLQPGRKLWRPPENVNVLRRCKSEPLLWKESGVKPAEVEVLYLAQTWADIFSSPESWGPQSQRKCSESYNKDAKVLVNVTVEGSPGPIRTMIKIGTNVEEMIKLVVIKYNEEGRTPRLVKDAASTCELHDSCFSLQSFSKSDLIGDVGNRSFYLRKNNSTGHSSDSNVIASNQLALATSAFPLVEWNIKKFFRRMRKLGILFGCISCTV